jgi:hypothetical protein
MMKVDSGVASCDRRLWCAVILQAATDIDLSIPKIKPSPRRPNPKIFIDAIKATRKEARQWFLSGDRDVGSFRWICDTLDLDYYRIQALCMTRHGRRFLTGNDRRTKSHKKRRPRNEKLLRRKLQPR